MKKFLEGLGEGYYSLPEPTRRRTEILGIINGLLVIGGAGYILYDMHQRKKRRRLYEEGAALRNTEHTQKLETIREQTEKWVENSRERTKEIVDRATNPTPEDLTDIRRKMADPNHVWEL